MKTYLLIGAVFVAALLFLAGCTAQAQASTSGTTNQAGLTKADLSDPAANISTPTADTIPADFTPPA